MMAGELAPDQHRGRVPWDASCAREQAARRRHPTPFSPVKKRPQVSIKPVRSRILFSGLLLRAWIMEVSPTQDDLGLTNLT
jgi:hypothetical protein